jgi:hypothetical protein
MKHGLQITSTPLLCGQKNGVPGCYIIPKGAHAIYYPPLEGMEWDNLHFPCSISSEAMEDTVEYDKTKHGSGIIFAAIAQAEELPVKMKFWGLSKNDVLDIIADSRLSRDEILKFFTGTE